MVREKTKNRNIRTKLKLLQKTKDRLIILLKNDSRRFFYTTATVLLAIVILTSFLTTWYSTQQVNFLTYVTDNRENNISAYYSTIKDGFIPNYNTQYLEDLTTEIQETMQSIYSGVFTEKISSLMSVELFVQSNTSVEFTRTELRTTIADNLQLLNNSLIAGRMPENSSEILYLQEQNEPSYLVGEQISFHTVYIPNSYACNFTIVGILGPLENQFEMNGYSPYIAHWQKHVENYRYLFTTREVFYTSAANFFPAINSFSEIDTGRAVIVDFVYDYSKLEIQKNTQYITEHQAILETTYLFTTEPVEPISLCKDLYSTLQNYNYFWTYETIKSFLLLAPVFFLFFFVVNELNSGEQVKFKNIIYKMKLQGISNNAIRLLLLLKALLMYMLVASIGTLIGLLITLGIVQSMSIAITLLEISSLLLGPLYLTMILATIIALVTNMLLSENYLVRKTSVMISKTLKKEKQKDSKKRIWLTVNEQICFLIGLGVTLPGGILLMIFPLETAANDSITYNIATIIAIISWGLVIIGALILAIGVFNVIARIILNQIVVIGEREWIINKNRLGYILKNIITNKENYKRLIIIALIVNIGVLPGVIIAPSIQKQVTLERDLHTGCTDLVLEGWDNSRIQQQSIEAITGVQQTTEVSIVNVYYEYSPHFGSTTSYNVKIVVIHNCEEFNEVINWKSLGQACYSEKDIISLAKNLTYLMDKDFAKKHNFNDPEVILHNNFYGEKITSLDLEYINSFEYFPLLPIMQENRISFEVSRISFRLVTSLQTIQLLEQASNSSSATFENYLLVKTTTSSNVTATINGIKELCPWVMIRSPTTEESNLHQATNTFTAIFSIVCAIIFVLVVVLYGHILASIIYLQRLRIIETEFRLGINKRQIGQGMLLEVLLTTSVPIILSILFSILYMLIIKQTIPIQEHYHEFSLWMPWWLLLLLILLGEGLILGGNSSGLLPLLKRYQPVKVE